ncbi:unnamed protein product [Absidia cylindrospora]
MITCTGIGDVWFEHRLHDDLLKDTQKGLYISIGYRHQHHATRSCFCCRMDDENEYIWMDVDMPLHLDTIQVPTIVGMAYQLSRWNYARGNCYIK